MDASASGRARPSVSWGRLALGYVLRAIWVAVAYGCYQLAVGTGPAQVVSATAPWVVLGPAVAIGLSLYRRRERMEAAPAHLTPEQRARAWDASLRGPVPLDRGIRTEALRLARTEAPRGNRDLVVVIVVAGLVTLGTCVAAVLVSPWWWGTALAFAVAGLVSTWSLRRRRARLIELEHLAAEAAARKVSGRGRRASP